MLSATRTKVFKELFIPGMKGPALTGMALVLIVFLVGPSTVLAVDNQVQGGVIRGNAQVEQEPVDVNEAPGAQVDQEIQDLMDIMAEEGMIFFDPESIPDSVPPAEGEELPEAAWIFRVPVNVSNLSSEVKKIAIHCLTLKITQEYDAPFWGNEHIRCGEAKQRVVPVDGSYQGTVIVGVPVRFPNNPDYYTCDEYDCKMYLVDADDHWNIPSTENVSPIWRKFRSVSSKPSAKFRPKPKPSPV